MGELEIRRGLRTWEWGLAMRERRRRKASRTAPSEARAEDLMARRSAGSTEGAVVEVARSMRAAMEESAAGVEGEALGPCSDDGGRPEARGIAAWRGVAESRALI